jgi:hypothetical protein
MTDEELKSMRAYEQDSLATYLASSLNVELVNIILESLSTKLKGVKRNRASFKNFTESDYTKSEEILMESFKIMDPYKLENQ